MNKKKDALLLLSPSFALEGEESYFPSQERFILTLNRLYPSLNIVILSFHFPIIKDKSYLWHGNKVITFNGGLKGKWNSLKLWMSVWKRLSALKKKYNVVGMLSFFCSECAFVGHYFSKWNHVKHHIWVLGQDAKANNKQVKRIRPTEDELVTISDSLVREFEQNHGIKPKHVISIGVDVNVFKQPPLHRTIDIIGAGSLIPLKQYNLFVDAIGLIARQMPDIKAMICGNGPEEQQLKHQIASQHLERNIDLSGLKRNYEDVMALFQQSKILLHPSSTEGFGQVHIEALYAGAHVISFVKPLDRDIENWYIVNDVNEMAHKALEILQNPQTRYHSILPITMEQTVDKMMQLYHYPKTQ